MECDDFHPTKSFKDCLHEKKDKELIYSLAKVVKNNDPSYKACIDSLVEVNFYIFSNLGRSYQPITFF